MASGGTGQKVATKCIFYSEDHKECEKGGKNQREEAMKDMYPCPAFHIIEIR